MSLIKIGICHNYCCKENFYEIYHVSKNIVSDDIEILLLEYTKEGSDIMINNPFDYLIKNKVKYEEGNENKYENCDFKLYSQDC